jgi:hypothetical protein
MAALGRARRDESRTPTMAPGSPWHPDPLRSAQPFLPDFLTVCVYVVLGFFWTVLFLTNLPVFALLFTLLGVMGNHLPLRSWVRCTHFAFG